MITDLAAPTVTPRMDALPTGMLERVREAEWEAVKDRFRPGMRILDVGGGNGYQAMLMSSYGCDVTSIDLAGRPSERSTHFRVETYDGAHIPAPDASFDAVFSSNVLEHIADLPNMLAEMRRVLRPDGFALHVMPSATWRWWTSCAAFVYLLQRPVGRRARAATIDERPHDGHAVVPAAAKMTWVRRAGQAFIPHGEYANAFVELYYFSRRRWTRVFEGNGWTVESATSGGIYYSGYLILRRMPIGTRRALSRVLGSSMNVFVTRPGPARG